MTPLLKSDEQFAYGALHDYHARWVKVRERCRKPRKVGGALAMVTGIVKALTGGHLR